MTLGDLGEGVAEVGFGIYFIQFCPLLDRHRCRRRQRDSSSARGQSPGHSAHVGQEVEVHYRWHALYGRRVRRQYIERRASGEVVHVEVAPGVIIVVAAWMLDVAACAGMALGS